MPLTLRIRDLRKERGWSLETLAGKVGVSAAHMSEIERGKKRLNDIMIEKLSVAFNVEPYEILSPRQDADDILQLLSELSEEDRARVRAYADALALTSQRNRKD